MGQFGYAAIQPDNRFYIFFFLIDIYDFSFGAFRLNMPIHVLDVLNKDSISQDSDAAEAPHLCIRLPQVAIFSISRKR